MFDDWDDDRFAAWLGGFFDGEGCIYMPQIGVEVSIANTVRSVILAIQRRLGVGIVTAVKFSKQNWKTKYHWRVRNYLQSGQVLRMIRPHLVVKADSADRALAKISAKLAIRQERRARNLAIMALVEQGVARKKIAAQFGIDPLRVNSIVYEERHRDVPAPTRAIKDPRTIRWSKENGVKQKVKIRTRSRRIAWMPHRERVPRKRRNK